MECMCPPPPFPPPPSKLTSPPPPPLTIFLQLLLHVWNHAKKPPPPSPPTQLVRFFMLMMFVVASRRLTTPKNWAASKRTHAASVISCWTHNIWRKQPPPSHWRCCVAQILYRCTHAKCDMAWEGCWSRGFDGSRKTSSSGSGGLPKWRRR